MEASHSSAGVASVAVDDARSTPWIAAMTTGISSGRTRFTASFTVPSYPESWVGTCWYDSGEQIGSSSGQTDAKSYATEEHTAAAGPDGVVSFG